MKIIQCILLILVCSTIVYGQETETKKDWSLTPLLNYEYLSLDDQRIHTHGGGLIFTKGNMNPLVSEERNSLFAAGIYNQYDIMEKHDDYPNLYFDINFIVDRKIKRHLFLGIVESKSDKPFYGGLRSFIAGTGYGYEFIRNDTFSLTLGIGLGVGEFELFGQESPVMPIPIIRFNVETNLINLSFEFLSSPVLTITLFPDYRLRLENVFTAFDYRDIRDFIFDTKLMYRFFSNESKFGDFAGVGVGFKNWGFGFPISEKSEKDKSYELVYNSVYGLLDLSFLQIQGGYAFNGLTRYDSDRKNDIGNGFFINVVLAWQF